MLPVKIEQSFLLQSFLESPITLEMNTSLERTNVLTISILPFNDRSVWDQTIKVFFTEPNLSKKSFLLDNFIL